MSLNTYNTITHTIKSEFLLEQANASFVSLHCIQRNQLHPDGLPRGEAFVSYSRLATAISKCTRVVTEINGHVGKWSSKLSNLISINKKLTETK